MQRDFTYIDDIIEGVVRVMAQVPVANPQWSGEAPDPGTSYVPYRVYNIGNNQPIQLEALIAQIETELGKKARKNYLDMQPGDVEATYADIDDLENAVGFRPQTSIKTGIERFIEWYRGYYHPPQGS
jgi:UDP-glucuronate 4-epimerase